MEFKKIEEIRQQERGIMAGLVESKARRESALEEVQALKADYERVIRASLEAGTNADTELDTLSDQIEAAEKAFTRRDREYEHINATQTRPLKPEDIIEAWNTDFIPKFKKDLFDPAVEAMLSAKLAYIDAFQKYRGVVKKHAEIKGEALMAMGGESAYGSPHRYSLRSIDFETPAQSKPYVITGEDLYYLFEDKPPVSIQYVKRGVSK